MGILDFLKGLFGPRPRSARYGSFEAKLSINLKPGTPEEVKEQLERLYKETVRKYGADDPFAKALRAYIDKAEYINAPFTKQ